jgi:cytoskeletal protein RodZ
MGYSKHKQKQKNNNHSKKTENKKQKQKQKKQKKQKNIMHIFFVNMFVSFFICSFNLHFRISIVGK